MVNINLQERTVRYRTLNRYGRLKLYTKPDCVQYQYLFHWMGAQVQVKKVVNQCIVSLDIRLFCCLVSVCVCVFVSVCLSVCRCRVHVLSKKPHFSFIIKLGRLQPKLFV
jgi:hypothetical protein